MISISLMKGADGEDEGSCDDDRIVSGISQKRCALNEMFPRRMLQITKIDRWFIDKIAILVEMEQALKTQKLTKNFFWKQNVWNFRITSSQTCGKNRS